MPWIETDRLRLRPFGPDDAEALHRVVYSDPAVMAFLPGRAPRPLQRTEEAIEFFLDHWRRHGFGAWAVGRGADGVLLGQVGLQYLSNSQDVELFYAIGSPYWGQGYATEAGRASLRYGFEEIKLRRIVGLVAPDNEASERVLRKLGMHYERMARHYGMKLKQFAIADSQFDPGEGAYHLHD